MEREKITSKLFRRSLVFFATLVCWTILACGEGKPTQFSPREPIPLGKLTLTVSSTESRFQMGYSTSGTCFLVVFFTLSGVDSLKGKKDVPGQPISRLMNYLYTMGFTLATEDGRQYQPTFRPEVNYPQMGRMDLMDIEALWPVERWLAIYKSVLENSRGLTLLIKNPYPMPGQPELAAVPLGR